MSIDPASKQVITDSVAPLPHLLGSFKPELQNYARTMLEERGVKLHTGTGVRKIGPASIELANGEMVKTHTLIWAAGLKASG